MVTKALTTKYHISAMLFRVERPIIAKVKQPVFELRAILNLIRSMIPNCLIKKENI